MSLVGAGPGDADLLTREAVRAIRRPTVVLADDLVGNAVLRFVRRSAGTVHVGKRGSCASTAPAFIEKLKATEALKGETLQYGLLQPMQGRQTLVQHCTQEPAA